jgi:hypothetical protein
MGGRPFSTRQVAYSSRETTEGRACTFLRNLRVPFAKSCRVTLTPKDGVTLPRFSAQVTYGLWKDGKIPDLGRMGKCVVQSLENKEVQGTETEVDVLKIEGRGLLYSLHLGMRNPDSHGQFMEGNVEIYIDGETKSRYASSGTEEFFFGGIYFINPFWTSHGGCTLSVHDAGNKDRSTSMYRVFEKDPIPFDKSLRVVWHNGQKGQGDVPGTTYVDAQSVVYLQREKKQIFSSEKTDITSLEQRLALLDGYSEIGPLVTEQSEFGPLKPGTGTTILSIKGAGHSCRIHLRLKNKTEILPQASIQILRDGKTICDEPIAMFFGASGSTLKFANSVCGQTIDGDSIYLRRDIIIPHRRSLEISLESNEESNNLEGLILLERRISRQGVPVDFGPVQSPRFVYGTWSSDKIQSGSLVVKGSPVEGGEVCEIAVMLSGIPHDMKDVPISMSLICDNEKRAEWTPHSLVSGLDNGTNGVFTLPHTVCIRNGDTWSALVSLHDTPFSFNKDFVLVLAGSKFPDDANAAAHVLVGGHEAGQVASVDRRDFDQRLNALDNCVLAGRAVCTSALENGDIDPGKFQMLFQTGGYGTIQCIRVGTPGSAQALRRSGLSMKPRIYKKRRAAMGADVQDIFAMWFDPFPFWKGTDQITCPSQLHRKSGGTHTSGYCFLNIPYNESCKIRLSSPGDVNNVMGWIEQHHPGKTPREISRMGKEIPKEIKEQLLDCANIGLFVQVYSNTLPYNIDRGRWNKYEMIPAGDSIITHNSHVPLAHAKGPGVLHGIQFAVESPEVPVFKDYSFRIIVDDDKIWEIPKLQTLFLGTPATGSGEGRQWWEDGSTRGRNAPGDGNRLLFPEAGTTIYTSKPPYRFGGYRFFLRDAITFEKSIWVICQSPDYYHPPSKIWSLITISTE